MRHGTVRRRFHRDTQCRIRTVGHKRGAPAASEASDYLFHLSLPCVCMYLRYNPAETTSSTRDWINPPCRVTRFSISSSRARISRFSSCGGFGRSHLTQVGVFVADHHMDAVILHDALHLGELDGAARGRHKEGSCSLPWLVVKLSAEVSGSAHHTPTLPFYHPEFCAALVRVVRGCRAPAPSTTCRPTAACRYPAPMCGRRWRGRLQAGRFRSSDGADTPPGLAGEYPVFRSLAYHRSTGRNGLTG